MKNNWEKIFCILKQEDIDAWMLITDSDKDPYYHNFIASNTSVLSIAIFTMTSVFIFVSDLEKELIKPRKNSKVFVFSQEKNNTLEDLLIRFFKQNLYIKKIALNYTTMNDINIDTLGHGFFTYYSNLLIQNIPHLTSNSFISAETIIYALSDRKSEEDIKKMKIACNRALEILLSTFSKIRPGMTEIEVALLTQKIAVDTREQFLKNSKGTIIQETFAWEKENCPIVLTGKNLLKGGHALSSNTVIQQGNTVYLDFGVTLTFSSGDSWSSDIQRTGYVLKEQETEAPIVIQKRFEDIINSISMGIQHMKIGTTGYAIDQIVRSYLIDKGYPTYNHATGHSIGEKTHNPGTNLTNSKMGTGRLKIQPNGVYTIEPRIALENGVSIEEMVVVRKNGQVETLCPRQTSIIFIQ